LLVKLVGMVVEVHDSKGNKLLIAIIVAPMGRTSWDGKDVTPTNPVNPLMLVCSPALSLLLSLASQPSLTSPSAS
jgi:hypothetical protein